MRLQPRQALGRQAQPGQLREFGWQQRSAGGQRVAEREPGAGQQLVHGGVELADGQAELFVEAAQDVQVGLGDFDLARTRALSLSRPLADRLAHRVVEVQA